MLPSNILSIKFDQVQCVLLSTLSLSGLSQDNLICVAYGVGALIFIIVVITVICCCKNAKRKAKRKATINQRTSARLIPKIEKISSNKRGSTASSVASYIKPKDINVDEVVYSRNFHTPEAYVKLKRENGGEDQGRLPRGYSGSFTKSNTNSQHTLTPPSSTGSHESEQPRKKWNYAKLKVSIEPSQKSGSTQYVRMVGRSIEGGLYITPPIHSTEISRSESYIDLTENHLGLSSNLEKRKKGDYDYASHTDIKNGTESESETNDYQNSPRKRKELNLEIKLDDEELIKPVEETRNEYMNTPSINNNHEAECGNSPGNEFHFNQKDTCQNYQNSSNLAKQKKDRIIYANLTEKLTPIPVERGNPLQKDKNKGKRVRPTPPKRGRPTPPKRGLSVKKDNQNINSQVEETPTQHESITKNKEIKENEYETSLSERPASVKHSDESEAENNYNDVIEITKRESSAECNSVSKHEKRDSSYMDMEGLTLYQDETPLENKPVYQNFIIPDG